MVKVSIEVRSRATNFGVAVHAVSIQRAVTMAESLYSAGDVRVIFPLNPRRFFVEDDVAQAEQIEFEEP